MKSTKKTCRACGGSVSQRVGTVTGSPVVGPDVQLSGLTINRCDDCSDEGLVIPHPEELLEELARVRIHKRTALAPEEIRDLRKWMGLSGQGLARLLGVQPESVSRWENGRLKVRPLADRALRLLVAVRLPRESVDVDFLTGIDLESTPPLAPTLKFENDAWREVGPEGPTPAAGMSSSS
ncbi:MAG: type II TA system antitoxin MqsA family protein [Acidobacteriota bacterium]